jgi:hypothetical protein
MNTELQKKDFNWLVVTFIAFIGLGTVELFEQITYVTNWLVGDIVENAENFKKFHHVIDAGVFHFPASTIVLIGFIALVRKNSNFMKIPKYKSIIWKAFIAFLITYIISIYIITQINVPLFNLSIIPDSEIPAKLKLWGVLNIFRFVLPAYGVVLMTKLFRV